jgi:hypothetical protein
MLPSTGYIIAQDCADYTREIRALTLLFSRAELYSMTRCVRPAQSRKGAGPHSFCHPSYWETRDYSIFTGNLVSDDALCPIEDPYMGRQTLRWQNSRAVVKGSANPPFAAHSLRGDALGKAGGLTRQTPGSVLDSPTNILAYPQALGFRQYDFSRRVTIEELSELAERKEP